MQHIVLKNYTLSLKKLNLSLNSFNFLSNFVHSNEKRRKYNLMNSKEELFKAEAITAGQKLFQQFGFHKTTMEDIANEMGRAKSTLYYYYKNKEEIFDAVIRKEISKLRAEVKIKVEAQRTMKDKIKTYFLEFFREISNKVNLHRVIIKELIPGDIAHKYFFMMIDHEKEYMIKILKEGYDLGEHRLFEKEDIPLEAEMFLIAIFGIVQYSVVNDSTFNEANLQKITDHLLPRIL